MFFFWNLFLRGSIVSAYDMHWYSGKFLWHLHVELTWKHGYYRITELPLFFFSLLFLWSHSSDVITAPRWALLLLSKHSIKDRWKGHVGNLTHIFSINQLGCSLKFRQFLSQWTLELIADVLFRPEFVLDRSRTRQYWEAWTGYDQNDILSRPKSWSGLNSSVFISGSMSERVRKGLRWEHTRSSSRGRIAARLHPCCHPRLHLRLQLRLHPRLHPCDRPRFYRRLHMRL